MNILSLSYNHKVYLITHQPILFPILRREDVVRVRVYAQREREREMHLFPFTPVRAFDGRALSAITARLLLFRQVKSVECRYGVTDCLGSRYPAFRREKSLVDRASKPRLVSAVRPPLQHIIET